MLKKKVILIGTSHTFQRAGNKGSAEFEQFIRQVAAEHKVLAIAEEMSPEALRDGEPAKSVCHLIAADLILHHRFCDPETEERNAAGIVGVQQIQIAGWQHHDGQDGEWAQAEIKASHDKREAIWLSRMQELDVWPLLFVCGANHATSFSEKLEAATIAVELIAEDWALPQAEEALA